MCILINVIALMGQFYVALYPVGGPNLSAEGFFELYLAGPLLIGLYAMWKLYSWFYRPADRPLFIRTRDIDIYTGMRERQNQVSGLEVPQEQRRASIQEMQQGTQKLGAKGRAMSIVRAVF